MKLTLSAAGMAVASAATLYLSASVAPTGGSVHFTDITEKAGIRFVHHNGAFGKKYLPETMGSGCAFIDYDGDGYPDILLINSKDWTPKGQHFYSALYRNNRNGTFTDVTHGSGLDVEMFGTSAAWLDYDKDGKPDLFVANYVQWTVKGDPWCSLDGVSKSYCTPEKAKGAPSKLYRNLGNGRFEDVSVKAGVADSTSKSMGVLVVDYNNDGWPDLFISNDTQPNRLYRNNKDGTFKEEGVPAGVAYGEDGTARGAMGVDWADYDRSGRASVLVGNFSTQMLGLYHNEGNGIFMDQAPSSVVGRASLLSLTFGAFFFDYDLDGFADIFAANGHTENDIGRVQPRVRYQEPPLLFRNVGGKRFEDSSNAVGADFSRPIVARGAAYADIDRDGDLDVLLTTNNGPAILLRNDGGNRNKWISLRLQGTRSNRSALGATVRVESAQGRQWNTVRSGGSYCSQSDLALTFGLGQDAVVKAIDIEWPSGVKQHFAGVAANQSLRVDETKGIMK